MRGEKNHDIGQRSLQNIFGELGGDFLSDCSRRMVAGDEVECVLSIVKEYFRCFNNLRFWKQKLNDIPGKRVSQLCVERVHFLWVVDRRNGGLERRIVGA